MKYLVNIVNADAVNFSFSKTEDCFCFSGEDYYDCYYRSELDD